MKKLLLLLGAFTLVGSAAMADEFRPTGSVKQEIRWYGDKEEVDAEGLRFTMAEGGVRFTENFYVDYRVRDYISYKGTEDATGKRVKEGKNSKEIRTRLYYDHGQLGNTEITVRERFGVEGKSDANKFYYTPEFSFKNYVEGNDYIVPATLTLRPEFKYNDDNNANYSSKSIGGAFLSVWAFPQVPGDLSIEFNVYSYKQYYAADQNLDGGQHDDNWLTDVELYAYYSTDSVAWNGIDFNFYYEFGMDPATFYDRKVDVVAGGNDDSYDSNWVFYNDFELQASYAVNESTSVYGAIAAEFANQNTTDKSVSDWNWQPYAYVGWKTKF